MSLFTENLEETNKLLTYDAIRSALYNMNLPMDEAYIDEVYDVYTHAGMLPDFLVDYFDTNEE